MPARRRRRSSVFATLLAAATLVACHGGPRPGAPAGPVAAAASSSATCMAAGPDAAKGSPFTISIPDNVGEFHFSERKDFEQQAAGTMVRYEASDGLQADVFVYPADPRLAGCGAAVTDSAAKEQSDEFVGLIPEYLKRGYFEKVDVAEDVALPVPSGAAWTSGRHVGLSVIRGGAPAHSDFYLFVLPYYNIKVRSTFADTPDARDRVRRFSEGVARVMPSTRRSDP